MTAIRIAAFAALTLACLIESSSAQDIRKPHLDADGRFYVYKPSASGTSMPFVPYGLMPTEAAQMMKVNVTNHDDPFLPGNVGTAKTDVTCIDVKISWQAPAWCGCAFISGPDKPAWWAEDDRGWYYDLSVLNKKKLVFYARAKGGQDTRIQVKVGILGDKKYGDSMPLPVETRWLKLPTKWTRYELDLSGFTAQQLGKICNGLTFVTNQDQNGGASETDFSLSEIYFE